MVDSDAGFVNVIPIVVNVTVPFSVNWADDGFPVDVLDERVELGNGEVVNTTVVSADELPEEEEEEEDAGRTVPDSSSANDLVELVEALSDALRVDVTSAEEDEYPVRLDPTGTVCAVTNVVEGNDTVIVNVVWPREDSVVDDTSVSVDE